MASVKQPICGIWAMIERRYRERTTGITILSLRALELLAALLLICVSLMIAGYSQSPEKFFIKRFRPKSDAVITHTQLILRAFVGGGLLSVGGIMLAMSILFTNLTLASTYGIGMLVAMAVAGASGYANFRTWRYRRAADGYTFERRPESGRRKRIQIALFAVVVALIVWSALTIVLTRLLG